LISRHKSGGTSTYEIDRTSPIYPEMKQLLAKLLGITGVLRAVLAGFGAPKVEQAFIFGSVAQNSDSFRSDVDIFVVGEISSFELSGALQGIQARYGRDVNAVAYPRNEVEERLITGDTFLTQVWGQPKIFLAGDEGDLPQLLSQPGPYFSQEMGVGGYGRLYAGAVLGAVPSRSSELTEQDQESVEQWFQSLNPDATARKATNQVDWWQLDGPNGLAEWQGWLYPGPVVSIRQVAHTERLPPESALLLEDLVNWWKSLVAQAPKVLRRLGVERAKLGLTLNTYGSGGESIVDVSFRGLDESTSGAPASSAPPWTYQTAPVRVENIGYDLLADPTRSLLRHFSYRRLEPTLRSLGLQTQKSQVARTR
jgi:predicted nucleotidyltransferase